METNVIISGNVAYKDENWEPNSCLPHMKLKCTYENQMGHLKRQRAHKPIDKS